MAKSKNFATPMKKSIIQAKSQTVRAVAQLFGISKSAVSRICQQYMIEGHVHRRVIPGRPRKASEWQERALVKSVKRDPIKCATDVADDAKRAFGISMTTRTVRNILRRAKIFARRPARKPKLLEKHRRARLAFALAHMDWSNVDWGKVLWADETKFNVYTPDGGIYIRRPVNKRYNARYVRETINLVLVQ